MLPTGSTYEEIRRAFEWRIPERYNIGRDIADRQAPDAPALIYRTEDGTVERFTFGDIARASNRFANLLTASGLGREDRVAILLPQRPETAIAHAAIYKAGMIAIPLFTLFAEEALVYRLQNSGASAVVTDEGGLAKIRAFRDRLPELRHVFVTDMEADGDGFVALGPALERASDRFEIVDTMADDPALIIYTSGTTGPPKGALHAHRVLLGHLPGVELPNNFFPQKGDLFWTPADWAWIGGLIDVLLPSWHHGIPVLAYRARKFDPEEAFRLMQEHEVRNVFLPPTALKLMRQVEAPRERFRYQLRSLASGGETLGTELLDWGRETFGLTINEFYGQTECNLVVGNCADVMEVRPGSMGRAIPGHEVAVVDDDGNPLPDGTQGNIAVRKGDPVMFLRYWNNQEATEKKFAGDWLLTGDQGIRDVDGYFWYVGRDDDVITSAGYRIGPGEIEDCLVGHPAVAMAAVIGVPDPLRTQAVKAYIVLKDGVDGTDALATEIQEHVKSRLAAHEYPRHVAFVAELPLTTTGKIVRKDLRALHAAEAGEPE
ncbi:acyl-CoA synthetase [Nisaea acidiphila]|uniref:Acyl-CoA synthetase n=1 Tax=Nisaea acidiphila TaxID=1862145 RepID=A0A9J7ASV5_9PROT|nr:acyl-CoA synthetase [Nisaea acidiphila]UUX48445.1 acyl-CoA synthetase [Nisaea acidiphila]